MLPYYILGVGTELIIGNTNTAFVFPIISLLNVSGTQKNVAFKIPKFPKSFDCFEFSVFNGSGKQNFSKVYVSTYIWGTGVRFPLKSIYGTTLKVYYKDADTDSYMYLGIQLPNDGWTSTTLDCIRVVNYQDSLKDKIENYRTLGVSSFFVSDWTGYTEI